MFKLNEIKHKKKDPSEVLLEKFSKMHLLKVESLKSLTEKFPVSGEIYFLWTLKSFNAFTFITYIIKHCGIITNLAFSTYGINFRIVNSLIRRYDKKDIQNIDIIISDSIKFRMPKVIHLFNTLVHHRPDIKINYSWNHSKITLIHAGDNYFVIEGSGNFSKNAQHEQYIFLNNKSVYEFRLKNIHDSIRS